MSAPLQFANGNMLLCPVCGGENLHLERTEIYESSLVPDFPLATTLRSDRQTIVLQGGCENGHSIAIALIQYKGETYVEVFSRDWKLVTR